MSMHLGPWSSETNTSTTEPIWTLPRTFLVIVDPSIDLVLVIHSQHGALLLPWASHTSFVQKNWPISHALENRASWQAFTTSSCRAGSGGWFTCSFFDSRSTWSPTAQTYWWQQGKWSTTSRIDCSWWDTHVYPLHKVVACGEPALWLLPHSIREWKFEQLLTSCSGSNFHCENTELIKHAESCSRACDEFLARFWHAFQLLLLSFASSIHLFEECWNTWTHWVFAGGEFSYHPRSEFVPVTVGKNWWDGRSSLYVQVFSDAEPQKYR